MCICVYRCPRKLEEGARLLDFSATGVISCCGLPDVDTGNVSSGQKVYTEPSLYYNSYNPGWFQTHSVVENGLEFLISVSLSRVLGL